MPTLTIDERTIDVESGTKVIEAAARLGIMIPRFCYHPALGAVGACRVCAVQLLEGPVKGLQMSCMLEAADGMRVSTTDAEAVEFRRHVIEWLMLNHPHDCPVCDEGGHCLLQDMTVSGGHGLRRFAGPKRTYLDQELGPLVQHEMNRCIHCYRCARFYQEFGGYRDLGVFGLGRRTYFGRMASGRLESPFSGNLIDVCPTGVFTDKPSRFCGRRWDYQRTPTLCINCSLGCHSVTSVRNRQVVRQEARPSAAVNGWFLCDRGRYGFFYASRPERPRQAAVQGEPAGMQEALAHACRRLEALPPAAVGLVGSPRSSLETLLMAERAAELRGWRGPAFFPDAEAALTVRTAVGRLEAGLAVSLKEIEQADVILVAGADPLNEAPMLALAIRQAVRRGAAVFVLDPRPIDLPCAFTHWPTAGHALAAALGGLIKRGVPPKALEADAARFRASLPKTPGERTAAAGLLAASRRPVIVCGTDIAAPALADLAADATLLLAAAGKQAGIFYLLPAANAFAAGRRPQAPATTDAILEAAAAGEVRALIFVENDPYAAFGDRQLLEQALARVDLLIVLDYLDSRLSRRAHVFLPTQTLYEAGGVFINQEGRAHYSAPAFAGGSPVRETGGGDHPPRVYGTGPAGADPQPAWQVLQRLAGERPPGEKEAAAETARRRLCDAFPELAAADEEGRRVSLPPRSAQRFKPFDATAAAGAAEEFEILRTERTFGSEELSSFSACLQALEEAPFAALQRNDAASLGVREGERIALPTPAGAVDLTVRVFDRMAQGVMVVPRLRRLDWPAAGMRIRRRDVRRLG